MKEEPLSKQPKALVLFGVRHLLLDPPYLEELRRRAFVRGAPPSSQPDTILQREAGSGVLVDERRAVKKRAAPRLVVSQ
jgi:hypothetical protein